MSELETMSSETTPAVFRPLVYTVAFGDGTYFECLNVMLTSLLEIGRFYGNVAVLSDRPLSDILPYIPHQYRSRLHHVLVPSIDISQRYIIDAPFFENYSPILYLDTDIVIDTEIESTLKAIVEANGVCVTTEKAIYPELASSKIADVIDSHRIGNWFGLELCRADPACAQEFLPCANSGIIGYKDAALFRSIGEQIATMCQAPANRELTRWFGDQPILNYVLVRTQASETAPLSNRCKFVHGWDQNPDEAFGFTHFIWARGNNKIQQMAAYLENLQLSRIAHDGRKKESNSPSDYSPFVREKLETSSYIFVVTSALATNQGVLEPQVRFVQTLRTIQSIRDHVPDAFILLVDSSPVSVHSDIENEICAKADIAVFLHNLNPGLHLSRELGGFWKTPDHSKTLSETYALFHALTLVKVISSGRMNRRIFKISGRYHLSDNFDIGEYDRIELLGKYVFKRRRLSWLASEAGYLDTRLWSFCSTAIDETLSLLVSVFVCSIEASVDAEHAYFRKLLDSRVHEVATIHVAGQIASTGEELLE
ncbi:hypothetical protein [Mesorhizobium sp. L103C119B0]|uniref:hypothetical protein n=1 Tax=Mesorhizobium sp. L103C119B0 TaxID=1287085 RepID=UPI0004287145|nr:hypothetical protein [Mesorhizobium sp. L103C119B0]